jgi:hypothetical protein
MRYAAAAAYVGVAQMVYLALSPTAAWEAIDLARNSGAAVWVGSDALTYAEYIAAGESGISVSRFIYPLNNVEVSVLRGAIETIQEHHPNETIWVQANSSL